ncbi:MAG: L-erythrulose-1-phosphate isomerase [Candidatus Erwinia impunctatus]|nr:L-erythrulose-1-phosphate isomerase [Culicoides impunctatus]
MKKAVMVGTSWKMNKTLAEALAWCEEVSEALPQLSHPQIQPFVIPPFTLIHPVSDFFRQHGIPILSGGQNMHQSPAGAWTGEISASMLRDAGASLVELGHSERRQAFNESDAAINEKVHSALSHGLRPLVCVGDSAAEKTWGVSVESVLRQVSIALYQVSADQAAQVIFAYEPIWAIGEKGTPASPDQVAILHGALRNMLCTRYGEQVGKVMTLLYGGSVSTDNCEALFSQPDVDGLFIGRAAWRADGYCEIVRRIRRMLLAD